MTRYHLAYLASLVNPALLIVFVIFAAAGIRNWNRALLFLARSGVALLLTYFLAHLNRWFYLWKNHASFPSGHMTFYLSVATSFFLLDRRSVPFTALIALLYGWLIAFLNYHTWLDLGGALFFAVPATLICHWKPERRSAKEQVQQPDSDTSQH